MLPRLTTMMISTRRTAACLGRTGEKLRMAVEEVEEMEGTMTMLNEKKRELSEEGRWPRGLLMTLSAMHCEECLARRQALKQGKKVHKAMMQLRTNQWQRALSTM